MDILENKFRKFDGYGQSKDSISITVSNDMNDLDWDLDSFDSIKSIEIQKQENGDLHKQLVEIEKYRELFNNSSITIESIKKENNQLKQENNKLRQENNQLINSINRLTHFRNPSLINDLV